MPGLAIATSPDHIFPRGHISFPVINKGGSHEDRYPWLLTSLRLSVRHRRCRSSNSSSLSPRPFISVSERSAREEGQGWEFLCLTPPTERREQRSNQVPPNRLNPISRFAIAAEYRASAREPLYGETGSATLDYRRVKVRWVTPLGLFTDSTLNRCSIPSSAVHSGSPRPSTMGTKAMCM